MGSRSAFGGNDPASTRGIPVYQWRPRRGSIWIELSDTVGCAAIYGCIENTRSPLFCGPKLLGRSAHLTEKPKRDPARERRFAGCGSRAVVLRLPFCVDVQAGQLFQGGKIDLQVLKIAVAVIPSAYGGSWTWV